MIGNVMQDHFLRYGAENHEQVQIKHLTEKRIFLTCNRCNADGKIHGHKHAKVWHNKLKIFNKI